MAENSGHQLHLKSVDHIGIVVKNSEAVAASWAKMFGIGPWTTITNNGKDGAGNQIEVKLSFAYVADTEFELIEVVKGTILHSEFLKTQGEGLHHLGFFVNDVNAEASRLVKVGGRILIQVPGQWAYIETGGPGGVIFELIKQRGKILRSSK